MIKEKQINLIQNISYPYKVINSYFTNFFNLNEYNDIKNAVLGINDFLNKYHKYYLFYQILFSFKDYHNYYEALPYFKLTFNIDIFKSEAIKVIDAGIACENTLFGFISIFNKINYFSKEEGFLLFIVMQMMINQHYNSLIILPHDLFKETRNIKYISTLAYYANGILIKRVKRNERNLLNKIKDIYSQNLAYFYNMKIKSIYLFGSVKENEYHNESDIDMVVEFNNCTYKEKVEVFDKIIIFNRNNFGRDTDLQEYNDFIEINPNIKLLKII